MAAILDWRFLAAVTVLGLNDWWWKAAYGSWLTGKLSDVAGLVVLPVVAVVAVRAHSQWARVAVLGVIALWFAAMKTMASVAGATEQVAEFVTGRPSSIVVDPTDLVGLVGLVLAWQILAAPRPLRVRRRLLGQGIFLVASFFCVATSSVEPFNGTDIGLNAEGEVVTNADWGWEENVPAVIVTGAGQATEACVDDGWVCVRLVGDVLHESTDGATFRPVWAFDTSGTASVRQLQAGHNPDHRGILDVVAGLDGRVHALLGGMGPVTRAVDGSWSPPFSSFRPTAELVYVSFFFALAALLLVTGTHQTMTGVGLAACGVGALCALYSALRVPSSGGYLPIAAGLSGLLLFVALAVVMATVAVRVGGFPDRRVWPLVGVVVLVAGVLIGLLSVGGLTSVDSFAGLAAVFIAVCAVVMGALALNWRGERERPTVDVWLGLLTGLGLAAAAVLASVVPLQWWQRSVEARFVVAYPTALVLTVGVLAVAVWRRRALGLSSLG